MYLKSIEIQGFKSFANKLLFEFHNGITGIVGPNGSGKSNVADAVRWVLGEQRAKQLRGGNMQDVIFSGTQNRKPLSYASVSITLDNSDHKLAIDFEEVTVTRKIYRSGESEYLINGSACRLKDINELFYDTGIGKEGYSIIGQGQIDKILSGKPEERRELFDEAAGIVKFKRRKNTSIKKLEEEQQNLVRVNDILAELEKQFEPLKKQAEIARIYLKKKEALKTYDINLFLLETERLKEQITEIEGHLKRTEEELSETSARYAATKVEYEKIELQAEEMDDAIERAKNQLNETTLLKQQLTGQIELLKEQIHSARMNDEHYSKRAKTVYLEIEERQKQYDNLEKERIQVEETLSDTRKEEEAAKAALLEIQTQIAGLNASVDEKKSMIMDILNNRASTQAKIQHFHTMQQQIQVQKAELSKRFLMVKSESEQEREQVLLQKQKLQQISDVIRGYTAKTKETEAKIAELQKEIDEKNRQLQIGQSAYHREQSRLESLRNMTERYDGYGNSIRKVMENRNRETGLIGVVADIIKTEKQYELAIETALGGSIQNIVTADEDTAKRMIAFLKQYKFGRATFLPLTSVKGSGSLKYPDILKEQGVIGLANTLVQVEAQFRGLSDSLLGRTVVVKDIDTGIALARKYHQSIRMVTPEGDLLNPGGSMTGGAFKNSSNLLSRRREIEEFEQTVARLSKELSEAEQALQQTKQERAVLYGELDALKEQQQQAYVQQNTAKMNMEQAIAKQRTAEESVQRIQADNHRLEREIADLKENQESIELELAASQKLETELTEATKEEELLMETQKEEEANAQKKTEEIHLSYAAFEQKEAFILENAHRISEEIEKFREELAALNEHKGSAVEEIQAKETQIAELHETIETSGELFEELNTEISRLTKEKENLNQQYKSFLTRREELALHMSDLEKETVRLSGKLEGQEEEREKQINYMWEEYELTYSHALEIRDETLTDLGFMKKQIRDLKNEIRGLGNVNVNAIEDFKNLAERYEFLKTQHDDLVEAEATLKQIIEELDAAMRKQFEEQFAHICSEFNRVFKELFGGGQGTLELMEGEDILEAGIRIIAQPPGKKLQNMMQLSGGEKALTAIALLFAIQNLKPSPFCLLDEIEAALDDSNVTRFARYLHKLTKNTQFIVITHRRGTMTAADRLYGITMQEKGVSTLVSVDLLEHQLSK